MELTIRIKDENRTLLIDDCDLDLLKGYSNLGMHEAGYVMVGRSVLHRVILKRMLGRTSQKGYVFTHKNGNRYDNRRENLHEVKERECNYYRNRKYKGATWHKARGKWQSQIQINGKRIYLGLFNKRLDAHKRYLKALDELV